MHAVTDETQETKGFSHLIPGKIIGLRSHVPGFEARRGTN